MVKLIRRGSVAVVVAVAASVLAFVEPAHAATITSVTPAAVVQGGNRMVTIRGGTFLQTATVSISGGGVTTTDKTVKSDGSEITVTVEVAEQASPGTRTLTVTNVSGVDEPTASFTVNRLPSISTVTPGEVTQGAVNTILTLRGEGFQPGASVAFSDIGIRVRRGSPTFVDATRLTVRVDIAPDAPKTTRYAMVRNPDSGVGLGGSFTVVRNPTRITGVSPSTLAEGAVAVLAVAGSGFSDGDRISIGGGVEVLDVFFESPSLLFAVVTVSEAAAHRSLDVELMEDGQAVATCARCLTVVEQGYHLVAADGSVFAFGSAAFHGGLGGTRLNAPVVGMAEDPSGGGYWLVTSDGGIFAFGAGYFGSTGGIRLNKPIVGMAATPTGRGYWLVASDGGIFAFGDASFLGSTGAISLNKPVVGMAATPTGDGYWLVASDGGIFAFGDAPFVGSTGAISLNKPIVGMAAPPFGVGYWLVASDGGMFNFGDALFLGSLGDVSLREPIVAIAASPDGYGYQLVGADGAVFPFGTALFKGDLADSPPGRPIVGIGSRPGVRDAGPSAAGLVEAVRSR